VGMRRPQEFAVRHARQEKIVGEASLPSHFRATIHATAWYADDAQMFAIRAGILGPRLAWFFLICHLVSHCKCVRAAEI